MDSKGRILVAYFSAQGATARAAKALAGALGADLFEIEPSSPYTRGDLDWTNPRSRVCREHGQGGAQVDLKKNAPEGFAGYSTVFLGFPIWWYTAAWPVDRFVSANDFSGKKVVVFCTSGGSPLGDSCRRLSKLAGSGEWFEGAQFTAGTSKEEIADFARHAL
ncbi:MAG: flavodoxin [Succinivibrio sp.]